MRWEEPPYSHRHALHILENHPDYSDLWKEVTEALRSISDEEIIEHFEQHYAHTAKSISKSLNALIRERLTEYGWSPESPIFSDPGFPEKAWRLDFAKRDVSIEVGFNHGEAAAWNLMKPVLASELNHVKKAIQTSIGIVIAVTEEMKAAGGFDSAVGTTDKYIRSLKAMNAYVTVPIAIIGLRAPESFSIVHFAAGPNKTLGRVERR
jgi:hypothetical protein